MMGWQTSLVKQIFVQLKVVYNDDDDDDGDNKPSEITKHINLETNMLNLSQPWMCFQCYEKKR